MKIKFTKHVLDKITLFCITDREVLQGIENPEMVCEDTEKGSRIYLFLLKGKLYSAVVKEDTLITLYRTDQQKVYSRKRSGRWNCY